MICRGLTIVRIELQNFQIKSQCFKSNQYTSNRLTKCVQIVIKIPITIGIFTSLHEGHWWRHLVIVNKVNGVRFAAAVTICCLMISKKYLRMKKNEHFITRIHNTVEYS